MLFISPAGEPYRGDAGLRSWFAIVDRDADGAVNLAEFTADHQRFFKTLDLDHDGQIGGLEVSLYERQIAPEILSPNNRKPPDEERPARDGRPGGGVGGGPGGGPGGDMDRGGPSGQRPRGDALREAAGREGAARFSLINEPQPIRAADSDMDFRVTVAEWTASAARRFALLDHDHDMALTLVELSAPASAPGRRRAPPRR